MGIYTLPFSRNPSLISSYALTGSKIGLGIGTSIGIVDGCVEASIYAKDIAALDGFAKRSAEKVKFIFEKFIEKYPNEEGQNESIFCPISLEIFCFPMRTLCGHVFEYYGIREHLERQRQRNLQENCPLCRSRVRLVELKGAEDIEKKVACAIKRLFVKFSEIIKKDSSLPSGRKYLLFGEEEFYNLRKDYSSPELLRHIAKKIERNDFLSERGQEELLNRINEDNLSDEDAYIMMSILSQSMTRFKKKIDLVFNELSEKFMRKKQTGEISNREYGRLNSKLSDWYDTFIPKELE